MDTECMDGVGAKTLYLEGVSNTVEGLGKEEIKVEVNGIPVSGSSEFRRGICWGLSGLFFVRL